MEGNNNFNQGSNNQWENNHNLNNQNPNMNAFYNPNVSNNLSNPVEQPEKKNNTLLVFLVIILLLALGIIGYFYFELKNENDLLKQNQTNNSEQCNNVSTEQPKVEVISIDIKSEKHENKTLAEVEIPKITGNTDTINTLNSRILKDISTVILDGSLMDYYVDYDSKSWNHELEDHEGVFFYGDYNYVLKNDVIIIDMQLHRAAWHASGNGKTSFIYTYDIKADKEISLSEALTKIGYTDADFMKLGQTGSCDTDSETKACTAELIKDYIDWIKEPNYDNEQYSNSTFRINAQNEIEIVIDGTQQLV